MTFLKSSWSILLVTTISVLAYIFSMAFAHFDTKFDHRWITFWLHTLSVFLVVFIYIFSCISRFHFKKFFLGKEIYSIIFVVMISEIVNFLFLSIYPYVSISDELRDGGLYAMHIASGTVKNIFAYGTYNAHGLVIPVFSSFFYDLFGNNVLTYRLPAAILSCADVILLYILIRLVINSQTAFWSAIILATLPLHIYFAHTQVVVAFNFFYVPLLLLGLHTLLKRHSFIDYIFLGTLLGFVSGFHAAIRSLACVIFFILLCFEIRQFIYKKHYLEKTRVRLSKMGLLLVFIVIGFGPRLLFTNPQIFFHTERFSLENKIKIHNPITFNDLVTVKDNYEKSLMVYFYEPTAFFYPDHKPIFSPLLALFLCIGIVYSVFVLKNYFLHILLCILLVLPFINSAITDSINADHRISPIFAIAAVFVAIGVLWCTKLTKNKYCQYIFMGVILFYLFWQVFIFYINKPANQQVELKDYLLMHTLYFLQTNNEYAMKQPTTSATIKSIIPVCLYVSSFNYHYFRGNSASEEQQEYLLPRAHIEFVEKKSIHDNEIYISKKYCTDDNNYRATTHMISTVCTSANSYFCPLNYSGVINIHY